MTFTPPPPQGPPKRNNVRTVLIVVGVVVALCCVGAVTAGFLVFRGVSGAVKPAQDAASAYADDLRDGDYPGAYGRLCERVRSRVSQEVFADSMAQDFRIQSHEVVGPNVNNRNGVTTATVTMRITRPTGTAFNHTFPLVQESGTWKVCE